MAIEGIRSYWEEYLPGNIEIIGSGGISNNTMKCIYNITDAPNYAMSLASAIKDKFTAPKIEIIWDGQIVNVGPTTDGIQIMSGIRMLNWNQVGPVLTHGFLLGIITFSPGVPGVILMRFNGGPPEPLAFGSVNPSGPTRLRMRSDDDGLYVRLQAEVDSGSGFDEIYNDSFGDMPSLIGDLGDAGVVFIGAGATLEGGEYGLLDNIQIDEQSVTPPPPFTFPYSDGFEDSSWS